MVKAVECLPSKHEALSSNTSTIKKKNLKVYMHLFIYLFIVSLRIEPRAMHMLGKYSTT
jgi:hypothetical protein